MAGFGCPPRDGITDGHAARNGLERWMRQGVASRCCQVFAPLTKEHGSHKTGDVGGER